jgi:hypothetical protein
LGEGFFVSLTAGQQRPIQNSGAVTLDAITRALNERGIRSARGAKRHVSSVRNMLSGIEKLA